jgi:hypothetical protein
MDRSNYFRGLLVLFFSGEYTSDYGKEMIRELGRSLDFNHNFIENALNNFLNDKYILKEAPQFSTCEFAETFLRDGLRIAFLDKIINFQQIEFLTLTALKNNLSKQWIFIELENMLEHQTTNFDACFEIDKYLDHDYNDKSYLNQDLTFKND